MNVVIYARFSSSKQNETSIEAQIIECTRFCEQNNYTIIDKYIDKALTGTSDDRAAFQKMIEDSNNKEFQGVIVYQLDRFARNRYDSATYKAKLKKNGVKVYSAKENITDDASGILIESVLEGMAEYYSAELSQKVKRNLRLNAEKGFFNGGQHPLGYKVVNVDMGSYNKRKLEIDLATAPIVKEIFEMRASGTKILDLVNYLNEKGYKNARGEEFKRTSLQDILKNKRYIGTNIYNGEEFPNTIPAIIDKELFEKVQRVIDKYKFAPATAKAKEEYILTTKLYCGNCKERMVGVCGTSVTGTIYHYYRCNGVKKKICKRKNVPKEYIENIVVNKCRELLTDKNINMIAKKVYEICQKENSQTSLIKALNKEVKKLNQNIENLLIALDNGENADIISNRITDKRNALKKVKKQLEEEKEKIANLTEYEICFFLKELKNGNANSFKQRKLLVNLFVNKIYLYDKKMTIIFNVGKKKVTINTELIDEINTNLNKTSSLFFNNLGQPSKVATFKKLRVVIFCLSNKLKI